MDTLLAQMRGVAEALAESQDAKDHGAGSSLLWWVSELETAWEQAKAALQDPQAVYVNTLRGGIAKLHPNAVAGLYRGGEGQAVVSAIWREAAQVDDLVDDLAIKLCVANGDDPMQETWQTVEPGVMEPYGPAWVHYRPQAIALMRGASAPDVGNRDDLN